MKYERRPQHEYERRPQHARRERKEKEKAKLGKSAVDLVDWRSYAYDYVANSSNAIVQ